MQLYFAPIILAESELCTLADAMPAITLRCHTDQHMLLGLGTGLTSRALVNHAATRIDFQGPTTDEENIRPPGKNWR